jgi:hypothetical protein
MLENRKLFFGILVAHFLISITSILATVGWSMTILDTVGSRGVAPLGLQILSVISLIFTSPWFFLAKIPYFYTGDPFNPLWQFAIVLLINSIVVTFLLTFIWEKIRSRNENSK